MTKLIPDLARSLLKEYGTTEAAAEALIGEAQSDPAIYEELTRHALRDAAYGAIRSVAGVSRKIVWANEPPKRETVSTAAWGAAIADSLMDGYRLKSGIALGDGTKADLIETCENLESKALDMLDKAQWLRLIAQRLKGSKTVRQSLSETDLRRLQDKVLEEKAAA